MVVYPSLTVLVVLFWKGHRWARNALAVLFTGIGLTSLVAPARTALFAGESFFHALSGEQLGWSFVLVRLIHVVSVLSASVLMFSAGANAYFARHRRATVPAR